MLGCRGELRAQFHGSQAAGATQGLQSSSSALLSRQAHYNCACLEWECGAAFSSCAWQLECALCSVGWSLPSAVLLGSSGASLGLRWLHGTRG